MDGILEDGPFPTTKLSLCPKRSLKWPFFYKTTHLPSLQVTSTDPDSLSQPDLKRARALKHYGTD